MVNYRFVLIPVIWFPRPSSFLLCCQICLPSDMFLTSYSPSLGFWLKASLSDLGRSNSTFIQLSIFFFIYELACMHMQIHTQHHIHIHTHTHIHMYMLYANFESLLPLNFYYKYHSEHTECRSAWMKILSHIIHSYDTLSLQRNKKKPEVSNTQFLKMSLKKGQSLWVLNM